METLPEDDIYESRARSEHGVEDRRATLRLADPPGGRDFDVQAEPEPPGASDAVTVVLPAHEAEHVRHPIFARYTTGPRPRGEPSTLISTTSLAYRPQKCCAVWLALLALVQRRVVFRWAERRGGLAGLR